MDNLKELVSKKFGKKISNRGDCERLSEEIYKTTKKELSYNTLRRFFQLDKSKFKTRKNTLNILSAYIGYQDFLDFKINSSREKNWAINLEFHYQLYQNNVSTIISLLQEIWIYDKNTFAQYTIQAVQEFINRKNIYALLNFIKSLEFQITNLNYSNILLIAQSILMKLRKHPFEQAEIFSLANNKQFQELLVSNFIDYEYLKSGYFGKIIDSVVQYYNDQTYQFFKCLKINKYILNNEIDKIDNLPEFHHSFHPILKGRILSILYWANKHDLPNSNKFNLKKVLIENFEATMLLELETFAIITEDKQLVELLAQYEMSSFVEDYQFVHNEIHNLIRCLYHINQQNSTTAFEIYQKLNSKNVHHSHRALFIDTLHLVESKLNHC